MPAIAQDAPPELAVPDYEALSVDKLPLAPYTLAEALDELRRDPDGDRDGPQALMLGVLTMLVVVVGFATMLIGGLELE
jgi:hypothetical protein